MEDVYIKNNINEIAYAVSIPACIIMCKFVPQVFPLPLYV